MGFARCPGKQQLNAHACSPRSNLQLELERTRVWGAAAILTLMTGEELHAAGASGIGSICERLGIEWYHLPIRDFGVPGDDFEASWTYAGVRLRDHVRKGRNVFVHCMGGLGRSRTIAARLLVECGLNPDEAIRSTRAERPGAVETPEQAAHVRSTRPITSASDSHASRTLGCILGGAVGDAFGYAIEFDRLPEIRRRHGPDGLQQPVLQNGKLIVSDDTQMTLFTLEAMNLARATGRNVTSPSWQSLFLDECQSACLRWGETQSTRAPARRDNATRASLWRSPAMRQRRAPGLTCLAAVAAGATGTIDRPVNDSKGCGAVMRTAPIGLLQGLPPADALLLGSRAGAMTHGHVDGWLPAGAVAALTALLVQGQKLVEAAAEAMQLLADAPVAAATPRLLAQAAQMARQDASPAAAYTALGEGWTGDEALAIALYSSLAGSSFVDAIRLAANHDGDSDSTASITGQLRGTVDGITSVPHAWVQRLDVLPEALALIREFLTLSAAPVQWQGTTASKASRTKRRNVK